MRPVARVALALLLTATSASCEDPICSEGEVAVQGEISRVTIEGAWNGDFVPGEDAVVYAALHGANGMGHEEIIMSSREPYDGLPSEYVLCATASDMEFDNGRFSEFWLEVAVRNHSLATSITGDLVLSGDDFILIDKLPSAPIDVQVEGLEHCEDEGSQSPCSQVEPAS